MKAKFEALGFLYGYKEISEITPVIYFAVKRNIDMKTYLTEVGLNPMDTLYVKVAFEYAGEEPGNVHPIHIYRMRGIS